MLIPPSSSLAVTMHVYYRVIVQRGWHVKVLSRNSKRKSGGERETIAERAAADGREERGKLTEAVDAIKAALHDHISANIDYYNSNAIKVITFL